MDKKIEKQIRISDLKEAFEEVKQMDEEGNLYRILTSIENAIKFLEE